ncbi:TlpA family protein disulfide reductase [Verrucomicrobiota bacterium sgz303538]
MMAQAADATSDWDRIVELDAGPRVQARTQFEARQAAMGHLNQQEQALRKFLAEYPSDAHAFEARLRLSRVMQIRADFEKSPKYRAEAKQLLDDADKVATPEQRKEVDFARVTYLMRAQRSAGELNRDQLLSAMHGFRAAHPDDRRLPMLMVEVSTLLDAQPRQKRALLADAQALTQDESLKGRIADDIKRLDLLGNPLPLSFSSIQGTQFDLAQKKGRAVVIVFFADWSPPSTAAIAKVKQAVEKLPADRVQVVGVSLDDKQETAASVLKEQGVNWVTACDGKGWMGPSVRGFGVNALPTVWLVDTQGRLSSLNALDALSLQLRQVLSGPAVR